LLWTVNVTGAGEGTLEVTIMSGTTAIPHTVKPVGNCIHAVTFTPQSADTHTAIVKFNGEMVPGRFHLTKPITLCQPSQGYEQGHRLTQNPMAMYARGVYKDGGHGDLGPPMAA